MTEMQKLASYIVTRNDYLQKTAGIGTALKNALVTGRRAHYLAPLTGGAIGAGASLPFALPEFREGDVLKGLGILGLGTGAGAGIGSLGKSILSRRILMPAEDLAKNRELMSPMIF